MQIYEIWYSAAAWEIGINKFQFSSLFFHSKDNVCLFLSALYLILFVVILWESVGATSGLNEMELSLGLLPKDVNLFLCQMIWN